MARLLAAQVRAAALHLFEHVAVADRDAHQLKTFSGESALQAQVGHCGADDARAFQLFGGSQVARRGQQNAVAIDQMARGADENRTVGVAIECYSQRSVRLDHLPLQTFRV